MTKSLLCPPIAGGESKRITSKPLAFDSLIQKEIGSDRGAVVTFSGIVRDLENGRLIRAIFYEAYTPMAETELEKIIRQTEKRWAVSIQIQHKIGWVKVGEASLLIACAGAHRQETFEACAFAVDAVKQQVPLWKSRYDWV